MDCTQALNHSTDESLPPHFVQIRVARCRYQVIEIGAEHLDLGFQLGNSVTHGRALRKAHCTPDGQVNHSRATRLLDGAHHGFEFLPCVRGLQGGFQVVPAIVASEDAGHLRSLAGAGQIHE